MLPLVEKSNKKLFGSIDVDLYHFYHGDLSNRSYNVREYLSLMLYPFEEHFYVDDMGLISWKSTDSTLFHAFCRINEINNSIFIA